MDDTYHVVDIYGNIAPAIQWCLKNLGDPGKRWFMCEDRFWFENPGDATLFRLKWC